MSRVRVQKKTSLYTHTGKLDHTASSMSVSISGVGACDVVRELALLLSSCDEARLRLLLDVLVSALFGRPTLV